MKMVCLFASSFLALSSTLPAAAVSPYAGEEQHDIKALEPAAIDALRTGKGMGFAKAAELNGYPGPAHVLELADKLQLSPRQRAETKVIFARMQAAAAQVGAQLIMAEQKLDELFSTQQASPASLEQAVQSAAALEGRLRHIHLLAHLEQTQLLSSEQIERYASLRGYTGARSSAPSRSGHDHQKSDHHVER